MTVRGVDDVNRILAKVGPRHAKNIIRATVHDMAKQVRDDAREIMPEDEGTMAAETKHKRERVIMDRIRSTVRVSRKAFYWRFLEYGTGPDRVAHDFFLQSVEKMRSNMHSRFLLSFGDKFERALARARK